MPKKYSETSSEVEIHSLISSVMTMSSWELDSVLAVIMQDIKLPRATVKRARVGDSSKMTSSEIHLLGLEEVDSMAASEEDSVLLVVA
jgi:hypothetical protein